MSRAWDLARCVLPSPLARGAPRSVVHLVPSVGWGGAERLACTLARLSERAGWSARVDAPSLPALRDGLRAELGDEPAFHEGESSLRAWALGARARVLAAGARVVHAHLPYPDRLGAVLLASAGRPLVVTFQLLPLAGRWWPVDELLRWRSDNVLRRLAWAPRALRFVAPSAEDLARLEPWVPRARLRRIGNAPPLPRVREPSVEPLAWPGDGLRLLCVGRLVPQKGFDLLLEALAQEPARSLPWSLVLAGDGPERGALEAQRARLGLEERVLVAPSHPASALYPHAELLLSPSRWEGMPLVPQESVEAGVPALLAPIAPHRELLEAAPEGLLPEDPAAWPEALARFLRGPEARARLLDAERRALAPRGREAMGQRYLALYEELARLGPRPVE